MEKKTIDALRNKYVEAITKLFAGNDEEVLRTNTNEIAIPCVDDSGEDQWICITVKVPKGGRDGEPYDGYSEAEDYATKKEERARKAKEAADKKAAKIAHDAEVRAAKAAIKEGK